jgi:hypothetical protein
MAFDKEGVAMNPVQQWPNQDPKMVISNEETHLTPIGCGTIRELSNQRNPLLLRTIRGNCACWWCSCCDTMVVIVVPKNCSLVVVAVVVVVAVWS